MNAKKSIELEVITDAIRKRYYSTHARPDSDIALSPGCKVSVHLSGRNRSGGRLATITEELAPGDYLVRIHGAPNNLGKSRPLGTARLRRENIISLVVSAGESNTTPREGEGTDQLPDGTVWKGDWGALLPQTITPVTSEQSTGEATALASASPRNATSFTGKYSDVVFKPAPNHQRLFQEATQGISYLVAVDTSGSPILVKHDENDERPELDGFLSVEVIWSESPNLLPNGRRSHIPKSWVVERGMSDDPMHYNQIIIAMMRRLNASLSNRDSVDAFKHAISASVGLRAAGGYSRPPGDGGMVSNPANNPNSGTGGGSVR